MGYFFSGGIAVVMTLIYIVFIPVTIYIYVLMVKLARRGIKALDLYIAEKSGQTMNRRYE